MDKKQALQLNQVDFLKILKTSAGGLSQTEADIRLAAYGPNILRKNTNSGFKILVRQFQSSLIYLLMAASAIAYAIKDATDGTVILLILLINTLLGFFQEYKSEKIVEKLNKLMGKQARIKRNGNEELLDESQIVPGDAVIIREGDIVPADMRLVQAEDLQINESQLTGESVPVAKQAAAETANAKTASAQDANAKAANAQNANAKAASAKAQAENSQNALIFAGSTVEKGEGTGIVYAAGQNTELGTIAELSSKTRKKTQYEKSLSSFSLFLVKTTLLSLGLIFILKLILNRGFSNVTEMLLFIIAMAVAVVPEALPVIATVSLASGALRMAKRNVVVRRISSIEDLGNINLLCTDKTGTITENKMEITKVSSPDSKLFQKFAYASTVPLKHRKYRSQNSYDDAFIKFVSKEIKDEAENLKIAKELPFDPEARRRRVILANSKTSRHFLVVMGAPETLLGIAHAENKAEILKNISEEGSIGLHHLGLAYREIAYAEDFDILKNETDLKFLGYACFADPLRPAAKKIIEQAEKLGIKIKLLTGDSREVAQYVGEQVGLLRRGDKVCTGDELGKMRAPEFESAVLNSNVFARVSPADKFNIIKALKEKYVVGYQGDGINDAPALKIADVAIAVNSATDIAKENADIVLLNKGLEVIINGIKYGRSIFVNLNKYIKYTMISNFGNLIALSVLYLFSSALPILPVQILLTAIITDIPLITVYDDGVEEPEVVRPEKNNGKELILISLILGAPTALFQLCYFLIIRTEPLKIIQTSLYVFFTFIGLAVFYTIRGKKHFWKTKLPPTVVNISFATGFIFSFIIIYIGAFQKWFFFAPLPGAQVLLILALMVAYFLAADLVKTWYYESVGAKNPRIADIH